MLGQSLPNVWMPFKGIQVGKIIRTLYVGHLEIVNCKVNVRIHTIV